MRKLWRGIAKTVFWSYERGSWPYDVMVIVIVAFVLLTPRGWFHDQPSPATPAVAGVQVIPGDVDSDQATYRVDAQLLAPEKRINAGAYYDDVDGMFDDARAKINSTFDKFSQSLDQSGVSNKLVHTSVDGQDMNTTMTQAQSNALTQFGSTVSRSYRPLINQVETLRQPTK